MTGKLTDIEVSFVVGHARAKGSDSQRRPYVELIKSWAEHQGMTAEGEAAIVEITGTRQTDAEHMPKEFYQQYRSGERAEELIRIIRFLNDIIQSGEEMWTWAHVMRVMVDENILLSQVSINRFDAIICSIVPGKGRDTVRKNGNYAIMTDRDRSYHTWSSSSYLAPKEASEKEICQQIAQQFAPILSRFSRFFEGVQTQNSSN